MQQSSAVSTGSVGVGSLSELKFDVAIVGGGPGGSTVGSILKKYEPNLSVAIFER